MNVLLSLPPANIYPQAKTPLKDASRISIIPVQKSMEEYLAEVRRLFSHELEAPHLYDLSTGLQSELKDRLQCSDISMLPSYHHTLPSGDEQGTFLALDVGGSNFRLALIELNGKAAASEEQRMRVRHSLCFPIDAQVRALRGQAFFDWMADRIEETLASDNHKSISTTSPDKPLLMGLAWSFPIEQTSARSGHLLAMGKGFSATVGVQGQDLCELIMAPCRKRGLNVKLQSLVNDSSATLLSQAYREPTTRMSLILGTGTNSSIYLPVSALHPHKFGVRPSSWHEVAEHVVINTELSMHGKPVWPLTRWDQALNAAHQLPDFQPFEHLVGGRYLGEIARLILLEAICEAGMFDGEIPAKIDEPYFLNSSVLAAFEDDITPDLSLASKTFTSAHAMSRSPTRSELFAIRDIATLVSTRAAAYEAAAVHALWELRCHEEAQLKSKLSTMINGSHKTHLTLEQMRVTIACNGSILEKWPRFRERCQAHLDALTAISLRDHTNNFGSRKSHKGIVELRIAHESSMFGAAVAAASCGEEDET
ncbi:putative hexokinase [Myriangium duriaei CBS 260.36]|uniref:Phosphotransferase n=1 Tax=Myriangium duriaei CBS 260.36 TaxID=1168546 RepID=A0A9P4J0X6_9PEZI|nr:putative hexokinase [Myriangium duriaei CBS 260.36]